MIIAIRSSCRIKSAAFKFFLIQHTIAMGNIIGQFTRAQANCNIDFLITGNWLNEHEFEERSYCGRACDCNANIVPLLMCGPSIYPVYRRHPRRNIRCADCLRMNQRYRFIVGRLSPATFYLCFASHLTKHFNNFIHRSFRSKLK